MKYTKIPTAVLLTFYRQEGDKKQKQITKLQSILEDNCHGENAERGG